MRDFSLWLAVATGGGIGATIRYGVSQLSGHFISDEFPWGTLFVNVAGSFAMGVLAAWLLSRTSDNQMLRAFWGVGVLGGFTTFSAFSLETITLFEKKAYAAAGGYLMASVFLSVTALLCGLIIGRSAL
ncbi:MAG: fluoride efflux transporter CrcB [Aquisalinus sp.]|nr:fluoride efflux transporter CrcB [Aquisalinus sp.]